MNKRKSEGDLKRGSSEKQKEKTTVRLVDFDKQPEINLPSCQTLSTNTRIGIGGKFYFTCVFVFKYQN